jgi:hypothetical protein
MNTQPDFIDRCLRTTTGRVILLRGGQTLVEKTPAAYRKQTTVVVTPVLEIVAVKCKTAVQLSYVNPWPSRGYYVSLMGCRWLLTDREATAC